MTSPGSRSGRPSTCAPGGVEEHRGDHVHAADGDIGRLRAFRLDPRSGRVTHVLLGEGHLWGRKEVAIPFEKIAGFDQGIRLSLTRRQVQALPPADNGHSGGYRAELVTSGA